MPRVHVDERILMAGERDRIDPDKWRPLIMSFQQFYGLGSKVHELALGTIPESAYRGPDIERARQGRRPDTRWPRRKRAALAPKVRLLRRLGDARMSSLAENKAIVSRWFTEFWGKTCNLGIVDELASPDMLLQYSLHEPRRGRADIKAFMTDFRQAFPDLNFWGTAELIAEGDYVVGQWGRWRHAYGPAFDDFLVGSLPPATGYKMHFTGTTS